MRISNRACATLTCAGAVAVLAAGVMGCESGPGRPPDRLSAETERLEPRTVTPLLRPESAAPGRPAADERAPPVARVVERGTGTFVAPRSERVRATVTTNASDEITLNVVDAEIREVVRLVLEDALGANYVIDPAVGGRITVQTTRPLPAADLVPVLDAVLRMNGAALVQTGDLFKVVPIDQALTSGAIPDVTPLPRAGDQGFGVEVAPLRYVSATELGAILEPFAPPGGTIRPDPIRNLLLLAGTSDQLATLRDLVAIFDVDWLRGMSFGLFPLDTAEAPVLAQELDQIFGAGEAGPLAGILRFVPIERLNAIMVVSSQPDYLSEVETWIERLDRVGEGGEPQIYVYPVQNGRASSLAEVLSEIFGARAVTVEAPSLLAPGLEPTQLGSTQGFELGQADTEQQQQQLRPTEEQPAEEPGLREPFGVAGPGPRPSAAGPASPLTPEEIRIIADDSTNSLVIRASPRDYRKIREALERLDILPLQVLIEATIAEVTLSDELRYGVEWFFNSGEFELSLGNVRRNFVTPTGFAALFGSSDARILLTALEEVTDVNVISSPQLLVLDNQTARLQVGDQVPITVQQATPITGGADLTVVNSIELRDTGVILTVTPRVNAGGLVILEIQQEVSNVVRSETQTQSENTTPTINQRLVSSTVAVQSGETIALGGLITDTQDRSRSGVPILSSIPIIGVLFSTRADVADRTELLVLLTPRVIDSPERARAVTEELRRGLTSMAPGAARSWRSP